MGIPARPRRRGTPWTEADIPDLTGMTAVITGASSGIGLETAAGLATETATGVRFPLPG